MGIYTYRVLNDTQEWLSSLNCVIYADEFKNYSNLSTLRSSYAPHVLRGSTISTSWISTSKNPLLDIETYGSNYANITRNELAIIKNLNKTMIDGLYLPDMSIVDQNHKITQEDLKRITNEIKINGELPIVFDISTKENFNHLNRLSLISKKNSETLKEESRLERNGIKSEEVLVYRKIKYQNIERILSPFETDIFYSLIKSGLNEYCAMRELDLINNKMTLKSLNKEEIVFYKLHYIQRYQLLLIAKAFDFSMNEAISYKENVLQKIVDSLDIFYKFNISVPEKSKYKTYEDNLEKDEKNLNYIYNEVNKSINDIKILKKNLLINYKRI